VTLKLAETLVPHEANLLGRLFDRVDLIKPVSNVRPSVHLYMGRSSSYVHVMTSRNM